MSERRSEERVSVDAPIEVIDINTEEPVGVLVDISSHGFMLSTTQEVPLYTLYQFCLVIPDEEKKEDEEEPRECSLNIGAESVWVQEAPDGSHSWAGFQIIDISDKDAEFIGEMIEQWQHHRAGSLGPL